MTCDYCSRQMTHWPGHLHDCDGADERCTCACLSLPEPKRSAA